MIFIGLDVSTACTGVCVLDESGTILSIKYHDFDKGTSVEKAVYMSSVLEEVKNEFVKDTEVQVLIEEPAMAFAKGFSSANTISVLNQFNGMCQFLCFKIFGVQPILSPAVSIRKDCNIKVKKEKDCGITTKEQVNIHFESIFGKLFKMKELKSGPRKGTMIFDERNYDAIDAWVAAESCRRRFLAKEPCLPIQKKSNSSKKLLGKKLK